MSSSNKSAYGVIIFWMVGMQLLCSSLSFSIITHVFSVCHRLVKRKVNQNNQIALYGKTLKFSIRLMLERTKENPSWCRKENIQVIEILRQKWDLLEDNNNSSHFASVKDYMSQSFFTIPIRVKVSTAARIISEKQVSRLIVVDPDNKNMLVDWLT